MERAFIEKLIAAPLGKKFPVFYGNRNFITVYVHKDPPPVPILTCTNPVHTLIP
jgi:hypothetical protein